MGEIAEMMLDGTLCAACGTAMDDICDGFEAPGFPRYCCRGCEPVNYRDFPTDKPRTNQPSFRNTNCDTCGKRVRKTGLRDHMRDKHGVTE